MGAAATAFRVVGQEEPEAIPAYIPPMPEAEPAHIGRFYISNGYPMKDAPVDEQGRMWMLLKCFPTGDATTPREIYAMPEQTEANARYIPYFGLVSRNGHHDKGIVIGYVDDLYGAPAQVNGGREMTATKADGTMLPKMKIAYDRDAPFFGNHQGRIGTWDEIIAQTALADRIRSPKKQPVLRRSIA